MENMSANIKNKQLKTKQEAVNYYSNMVSKCINEVSNEMSDKEKQRMEARIQAKLKRGKKLTPEEMNYLRKYNPLMYYRALRIQKMADAVKEQLKSAKSKQQVDTIIAQTIAGISDEDPDKEYIVAAINEVANEFKKSGAYSRLPNTDEDARKMKNKTGKKSYDDWEDDGGDLFDWTPIQEIIDTMPIFNMNA